MQNATGAASAAGEAASEKLSLKSRALDELRRYLIITLYLWVMFALFSFYRRLILQEEGISAWGQGFAIINALVFAKVILVGQALNLDNGLRKYARGFIAIWNSLLFTILLSVFHILEDAIKAWFEGRPLSASLVDFGGGSLRGFLTIGGILFVALIPFFGMHEVARAVGGQALWDLFFSKREQTFSLVEN
jgi:hypothetical protein